VLEEFATLLVDGTLIEDRYRVVEILGSGASGAVLLVEDTKLDNTKLALKVLLPHLLSNQESIIRFRNETRITMSLSHPCIVQTYGLGRQNDDFTFLKMEYCEGRALREVIDDYPQGMPIDMALGFAFDVASALEFAHSRGVVHRDLKPENIIVSITGRARLVDFGLAQSVRFDAQATADGAILGTPYYMSPEQVLSEFTDNGVDIYSFGILLYEMIVGTRPFDGSTFWQLAQCHLEQELPEIKDERVSNWLKELIAACAQKSRSKRPMNMDEVCECLVDNGPDELQGNLLIASSKHPSRIDALARQGGNSSFSRAVSRVVWGMVFLVAFVTFIAAPHFNISARWRYAAHWIVVEDFIGMKIPAMRAAFNIPDDLSYPESFFGPAKTLEERRNWRTQAQIEVTDYRHYVRPLLHFGYDPNYFDPVRRTYPLHFSIYNNRRGAVIDFIEFGADPNLRDAWSFSALDYLVQRKLFSSNTYTVLLNAGANPNLSPPKHYPPIIELIERAESGILEVILKHPSGDPNVCDREGTPALFHALRKVQPLALNLLLSNGASPMIRDAAGRGAREYVNSLPHLSERDALLALVEEKEMEQVDGDLVFCARRNTS
jgi:serine/threonine protein kinase